MAIRFLLQCLGIGSWINQPSPSNIFHSRLRMGSLEGEWLALVFCSCRRCGCRGCIHCVREIFLRGGRMGRGEGLAETFVCRILILEELACSFFCIFRMRAFLLLPEGSLFCFRRA